MCGFISGSNTSSGFPKERIGSEKQERPWRDDLSAAVCRFFLISQGGGCVCGSPRWEICRLVEKKHCPHRRCANRRLRKRQRRVFMPAWGNAPGDASQTRTGLKARAIAKPQTFSGIEGWDGLSALWGLGWSTAWAVGPGWYRGGPLALPWRGFHGLTLLRSCEGCITLCPILP